MPTFWYANGVHSTHCTNQPIQHKARDRKSNSKKEGKVKEATKFLQKTSKCSKTFKTFKNLSFKAKLQAQQNNTKTISKFRKIPELTTN